MSINTTAWLCGPPPRSGQHQRYPGRFLVNLRRSYPAFFDAETLHMFSGSCDWGVSTDIRAETGAKIVAPYDALPCVDRSFSNVLADPPYADHWAGQWHADLPKPGRILKEAARLTRPAGLIGILHIIVIPAYATASVERIAVHPILCGPNQAMRCFNVFRKKS